MQQRRSKKLYGQVNQNVNPDKHKYHIVVSIAERPPNNVHITRIQLFGKNAYSAEPPCSCLPHCQPAFIRSPIPKATLPLLPQIANRKRNRTTAGEGSACVKIKGVMSKIIYQIDNISISKKPFGYAIYSFNISMYRRRIPSSLIAAASSI